MCLGIAAVLALVSCSKEIVSENESDNVFTIEAEFDNSLYCEDGTKADFVDDYKFEWALNDVVYGLYNGTTTSIEQFHVSAIKEDKSKATLTYDGNKTVSNSNYFYGAFYACVPSKYASKSGSGTSLTLTGLPNVKERKYNKTESLNTIDRQIPMVAKVTSKITSKTSATLSSLTFKPATGLLKFTYKNIPTNAAKFVISTIKTTVNEVEKYENLCDFGSSYFNNTEMKCLGGKDKLSNSGTFTITFNAGLNTELDFYVPAPEGTFSAGLTIELQDASGNTIEGTKKTTVKDIVVKNAYLVPITPIVL